MAVEWYLMKSPHDQVSGYEDDAFQDFSTEAFSEALDTSIATDVELYNYDLSECIQARAVVLGSVQDTKLKALNRQILFPIGTCKAGQYVKYKNRYWLIVGLVDDNKIYEKAVMTICNHLLTWLNHDNQIVQRWCSAQSASQYNNGETGSTYYTVRTDQLLVLTPDDDECLLLTNGDRFVMDRRCEVYERNFDESVTVDTTKPISVYRVTRSDSVLYYYQDSGHYEFMCYQDEQRDNDGYYVIDGQGYWLCGIPDKPKDKSTILSSEILYDSLEILCGIEPGIYTAQFIQDDAVDESAIPVWEIQCDFEADLDISYADKSIIIAVNDEKLINKSFNLLLSADGYDTQSLTIPIRQFM